jgi:hypothetical protein
MLHTTTNSGLHDFAIGKGIGGIALWLMMSFSVVFAALGVLKS